MQCLSCKNKTSIERCSNTALRSFLYCGNHLRSKTIRNWLTFHPKVESGLYKLQSMWRGYYVRHRIRLAGAGVLRRSLCHNEDEMVTMDPKDRVHPFDYFAVEQDGKVWWFDQRSMIEWSEKADTITNPYTRQILSPTDVGRLRQLYCIRKKFGDALIHTTDATSPTAAELRDIRWRKVGHILYECGFGDIVSPTFLSSLTFSELRRILRSLITDMRWWMYEKVGEKDPIQLMAKRAKYYTWMRSLAGVTYTYADAGTHHLAKDVSALLLACMNDIRNPSELCFFLVKGISGL